jgi:hypothetical protein
MTGGSKGSGGNFPMQLPSSGNENIFPPNLNHHLQHAIQQKTADDFIFEENYGKNGIDRFV